MSALHNKDVLTSFASDLLSAAGFTDDEAGQVAQSLILSNLYGHDSHGIIRIRQYASELRDGGLKSGQDLKVLRETDAILMADGGLGVGQVHMPKLLDLLIAKTEKQGTATGTIRNCGHIGRLGEWVHHAVGRGFAAMVMVNDNGTYTDVAAPGSKTGITSTNPVAFGVPLDPDPYIFDMSTSAVAFGKVNVQHLSGQPCPDGWIIDHDGNPSNDPSIMYDDPKGFLLPAGGAQGYKGFGLAMVVDMLVSGLAGGFCPPAPDGTLISNTVMMTMWNPDLFAGLDHMKEQAAIVADAVRAAEPVDPDYPVRLPGDRAISVYKERSENGIPVSAGVMDALCRLAWHLDVPLPEEATR